MGYRYSTAMHGGSAVAADLRLAWIPAFFVAWRWATLVEPTTGMSRERSRRNSPSFRLAAALA
jgi:hypothetical protein